MKTPNLNFLPGTCLGRANPKTTAGTAGTVMIVPVVVP